MTLDEKLAITCKAAELKQAGDEEGYMRLMKTAYLAKVLKEIVGPGLFIKQRLELVGSRGGIWSRLD